jgi:ABC-type multidrug transport system fused ATPase/permease subunit
MNGEKAGTLLVLLTRLWRHLERRRQRQFCFLMVLMLVSAFIEVLSLGAVLPFMGILIAPEKVFGYPLIAHVAHTWGLTAANQLVLPLTVAFALAAVAAGAIRILLLWANTRFTVASGADLSMEVYRRTLYQPYSVHVARNSSTVISGIQKVDVAVSVIAQVLLLLSSTVLLVAVLIALVVIDPIVASAAATCFGVSYGLISWFTRRQLRHNSIRIAYEQTQVLKALQEGMGGIRDVLLDGTQPMYCDIYRRADYPLRWAANNNVFIGGSPRFAMEALGMVLIAVLAYALSRQEGGLGTALPVLGALALGAQRLLPALQLAFSAWSGISGNRASLVDAIELLDQPLPADVLLSAPAPLPLHQAIEFKHVRFRYTTDGPWVLDGLDLVIPKGARIGFVGGTGSGKSTTLDLLMGLLSPTEGQICVDGITVKGRRLRAWQRNIAHVPQSIYLADASLAENIAFGVPPAAIDFERVRQSARQAQIADFIESRPDGYSALVGERGVRLSGGQRQRIGIARALYKQANVLVFDEATSALDNATEQAVVDAIEGLNRDLTMLFIAHRITTVRRCDTVVELLHGRVVAQGRYEQLFETSPSFRQVVQAGGDA